MLNVARKIGIGTERNLGQVVIVRIVIEGVYSEVIGRLLENTATGIWLYRQDGDVEIFYPASRVAMMQTLAHDTSL